MGVVAKPLFPVREFAAFPAERPPVKNHTRCACVDEPAHPICAAGFEDIPRADDVCRKVVVPRTPDTSFGGDVKDRVDSGNRLMDCRRIGQITAMHFDAEAFEIRLRGSSKTADFVSAAHQLSDDIAPDKTTAPCDQNPHRLCC